MMNFTEYFEDNLQESKSQLHLTMIGERPTIKQFVIITSENPMGKQISKKENKERLINLKADLKSDGFGYRAIKGMYETLENSVFIPNMTIKKGKEIASKYEQESFIFGKITKPMFTEFYYIETSNKHEPKVSDYKTTTSRTIYYSLKRDDFYSEYKGKTFVIPFFDKDTTDVKFKDGYYIDSSGKKVTFDDKNGELKKRYIEMYDEVNSIIDHINDENITVKSGYFNRKSLNLYHDCFESEETNYKWFKDFDEKRDEMMNKLYLDK